MLMRDAGRAISRRYLRQKLHAFMPPSMRLLVTIPETSNDDWSAHLSSSFHANGDTCVGQ